MSVRNTPYLALEKPMHEWREWKCLGGTPDAWTARAIMAAIVGEAMSPRSRGNLRYSEGVPYTPKTLCNVLGFYDEALFEKCFEMLKDSGFIEVKEDGSLFISRVSDAYVELNSESVKQARKNTRGRYSREGAKKTVSDAPSDAATGESSDDASEAKATKKRGRPKRRTVVDDQRERAEKMAKIAEDQGIGTPVQPAPYRKVWDREQLMIYAHYVYELKTDADRQEFVDYILNSHVMDFKTITNPTAYMHSVYTKWVRSKETHVITMDEFFGLVNEQNAKRTEMGLPQIGDKESKELWLWLEPRLVKDGEDKTTVDNAWAKCEGRIQAVLKDGGNASRQTSSDSIVDGKKSHYCARLGKTIVSNGTHFVFDATSLGGGKAVKILDTLDFEHELDENIKFWKQM